MVEYNHGMPTPPLSPKPGKKGELCCFALGDCRAYTHTVQGPAISTTLQVSLANFQGPLVSFTYSHRIGTGYPHITMEQDLLRLKHHLGTLPTPLLKHVHLQRVRRQNPNLFFAALADDIDKLYVYFSPLSRNGLTRSRAPLVYTPTVGEACQKYCQIYNGPEGLYLSIDDQVSHPSWCRDTSRS